MIDTTTILLAGIALTGALGLVWIIFTANKNAKEGKFSNKK